MRFFANVAGFEVTLSKKYDVPPDGIALEFTDRTHPQIIAQRITLMLDVPTLGALAEAIGQQQGKAAVRAMVRAAIAAAGITVEDLQGG